MIWTRFLGFLAELIMGTGEREMSSVSWFQNLVFSAFTMGTISEDFVDVNIYGNIFGKSIEMNPYYMNMNMNEMNSVHIIYLYNKFIIGF